MIRREVRARAGQVSPGPAQRDRYDPVGRSERDPAQTLQPFTVAGLDPLELDVVDVLDDAPPDPDVPRGARGKGDPSYTMP